MTFSVTTDVSFGKAVFASGDQPGFGDSDPTHAVKLRWTSGNTWTGTIGVRAGTTLNYKFISRSTTATSFCDVANFTNISVPISTTITPEPPAPYQGKTLFYLSGWQQPQILYKSGTNWISTPMAKVSAGRIAGENLFRVSGIGVTGDAIEFVPHDGAGHFDNSPYGGNYLTELDVFYLQDGGIFNYRPPSTLSAPVILTQLINSTAPGIPARNIKVQLPRGYTENTWKRYPVLYMHDGQNVFDPGGTFGSWSADATATRMIRQGLMRETIIVAIDNNSNRMAEYLPPTDSYNSQKGLADKYRDFVINNVRPFVDTTYRTLNDPANTLVAGSSLGGLVSLYMGRESSTFGKIGVLSGALWIAPVYIAQVNAGAKKPLRVYIDFGTLEPQSDWDNALSLYDTHLAQGYVTNNELLFIHGCGDSHNETAWARRLPQVFTFLLSLWDEPNHAAQREYPAGIEFLSMANGSAHLRRSFLGGFNYELLRSPDLGAWSSVASLPAETAPWGTREFDSSLPNPDRGFWRLRYDLQP